MNFQNKKKTTLHLCSRYVIFVVFEVQLHTLVHIGFGYEVLAGVSKQEIETSRYLSKV